MTTVTIYTKDYCPYCKAAKALLDDKGVRYLEIDVEHNPVELETMLARSGRKTVPQVFFDDDHIGGFDDLSALFSAAAREVQAA